MGLEGLRVVGSGLCTIPLGASRWRSGPAHSRETGRRLEFNVCVVFWEKLNLGALGPLSPTPIPWGGEEAGCNGLRFGNPLYLPDQQVGLNTLAMPPRPMDVDRVGVVALNDLERGVGDNEGLQKHE